MLRQITREFLIEAKFSRQIFLQRISQIKRKDIRNSFLIISTS